jgi:hypothetical protein
VVSPPPPPALPPVRAYADFDKWLALGTSISFNATIRLWQSALKCSPRRRALAFRCGGGDGGVNNLGEVVTGLDVAFHIHEQVVGRKLALEALIQQLRKARIVLTAIVDEDFTCHAASNCQHFHANLCVA